jgi:site-specific recombinase
LTKYHLRILRGDRSVSIELEDLTPEELRTWIDGLHQSDASVWLATLLEWVRQARRKDATMTNCYIRIMRDGQPVNLELEDLTPDELRIWVNHLDHAEMGNWLFATISWIRENVKPLEEDEEDAPVDPGD